ncbi:BTAD domain-containing putative transcriptional regulator [Kitasatospora sp. NPDC006697]|uniref:BTAD domain-containing putative transcriptional regulator n=1 Tax=Kitasatospora sp. NPDC006697 TaxID=3364020 RepID=UPI0036831C2F
MRFSLLGPLAVHDGRTARTLDGPKAHVLLGVLLLHANQPVPHDRLQESLWGERPPSTAGASLKNHIARLRRALAEPGEAEPRIRAVSGGYLLRVEPGELDTEEFTAALESARAGYLRRDWPCVSREAGRALALWRGSPMPELAETPVARPFVERSAQARRQALEWRIDAELELGRHQGLAPELTGLIAEQPLHEGFHRQLMLVLHRSGQQAEALAVFGRLRATLAEELGVDPGAEVLAAHQEILRTAPPAAPPEPPEPVEAGPPAPKGELALAAESLARHVHGRWIREEEQRRIHDPFPLPVRWRAAPAGLLDHWDNIGGAAPGASAGPVPLEGGLSRIAEIYRRVGSGRLVVLGRAGSGKSVLMLRFVLDYLAGRAADEPVPVIFSIGSWDPTVTGLRDWLLERLLRDHPNLAARTGGRSTLAEALVDAGWILPVLDGFDEIAKGLHAAALRELNEISLPLLLTSRTEQFAEAATTDVLKKAAGIELTDLTAEDLAHYLPRTARPAQDAAAGWTPVLAELRERPRSLASANLTTVLSTPLMVLLARTLYSDAPDQEPAALLDTGRFPSPEALEEHLLAGFVPTVYRARPTAARSRHHWGPRRAHQYLGHLAGHLDRHDLAWWRLSNGLSLPSRVLAIVLACGVVTIGTTVLQGEAANLIVGKGTPWISETAIWAQALMLGPVVGLAFGLVYLVTVRFGRQAFEPSPVQLRLPRRNQPTVAAPGRRILSALRTGLLLGFTVGLAQGPCKLALSALGVLPPLPGMPIVERVLINSGANGFILALAAGLALGLMAALEAPVDLESAATPGALLALNRSNVIRQALLVTPVVAVAVALVGQPVGALVQNWYGLRQAAWYWPLLGIQCGITGTLGYVFTLTAWGQWLLFTRIWLPLTGRLPWAVMAFLDDAYRRGVLRQVGAVYQFRHARLQSRLSPGPLKP